MEKVLTNAAKQFSGQNDCTQWFHLNCKYKDFEKHPVPVTCCFSSCEINGIGSL